MSAIVPENTPSSAQPLEPADIGVLIGEIVDAAAGVVTLLGAARAAHQAKRQACTMLGDLIGYIALKAPDTDPEITYQVVKALSVLEGIAE